MRASGSPRLLNNQAHPGPICATAYEPATPDRRLRLAGDLSRHRAAGYRGADARAALPARGSARCHCRHAQPVAEPWPHHRGRRDGHELRARNGCGRLRDVKPASCCHWHAGHVRRRGGVDSRCASHRSWKPSGRAARSSIRRVGGRRFAAVRGPPVAKSRRFKTSPFSRRPHCSSSSLACPVPPQSA